MARILDEIIASKRAEVEQRKAETPLRDLEARCESMPPVRDFRAALHRADGEPVRLLAEIKAASPSTGTIRDTFDAAQVASLYEQAGSSAISVLTDLKYFSGTDQHLQEARSATTRPVLRKDFTIDEYQLVESRAIGADAILLMAQVLSPDEYESLYRKAYELGLHVLAEGHSEDQLTMIASIGAQVVGINNRDFETMNVDLNTTVSRRHCIPEDRVLVSQSGVFSREDVERLEAVRIDAIQVGTSIMKDGDMRGQIDRLLGRD